MGGQMAAEGVDAAPAAAASEIKTATGNTAAAARYIAWLLAMNPRVLVFWRESRKVVPCNIFDAPYVKLDLDPDTLLSADELHRKVVKRYEVWRGWKDTKVGALVVMCGESSVKITDDANTINIKLHAITFPGQMSNRVRYDELSEAQQRQLLGT